MSLKYKPLSADSFMPFGKHKGRKLSEIAEIDADYIIWLSRTAGIEIDNEFMIAIESKIGGENASDGVGL